MQQMEPCWKCKGKIVERWYGKAWEFKRDEIEYVLVFRWNCVWSRKTDREEWDVEECDGWDVKDCDGCDGCYKIELKSGRMFNGCCWDV